MREGRKQIVYLFTAIALTTLLATLLCVPADFVTVLGTFAGIFILSASLVLSFIFLFELATMEE